MARPGLRTPLVQASRCPPEPAPVGHRRSAARRTTRWLPSIRAPGRRPAERSVEPGQEPRDHPVGVEAAAPGASKEPDEDEDGVGPELVIDPVPGKGACQSRDQENEADLREEGEVGS